MLYALVPGFIGDYQYDVTINITTGLTLSFHLCFSFQEFNGSIIIYIELNRN